MLAASERFATVSGLMSKPCLRTPTVLADGDVVGARIYFYYTEFKSRPFRVTPQSRPKTSHKT